MKYKRNRTIQEKIIDCLDNRVKNLHPKLREELIIELQTFSGAKDCIKIKQYVSKKLNLPKFGRQSEQYWISRGWSEAEAYFYSKEYCKTQPKRISPYSREFWVSKINPNTGKNYTIEEADFERNSRRPIMKEFWIKKGYSVNEAIELAEKTKMENCYKSNQSRNKNKVKVYLRSIKPRCL